MDCVGLRGVLLGLRLAAAHAAEVGEQVVEAGVELVQCFQKCDTDDRASHHIARDRPQRVVDFFAESKVVGIKRVELGEVCQILSEFRHVHVGRHAAGVAGDAGDCLLAKGAAFIAHLGKFLAFLRTKAHGSVAQRRADGVERAVEGGDVGGGEI